jgi:hypothetical protein
VAAVPETNRYLGTQYRPTNNNNKYSTDTDCNSLKAVNFQDSSMIQVVRGWLLTTEAMIQSPMHSCEISDGRSASVADFSASFLAFPMLIIISSFLHTHLPQNLETCDSSN